MLNNFNRFFPCMLIVLALMPVLRPSVQGEGLEVASGEAPQHPQQPQLAVDPQGDIHVVYGIHDTVCYRRSTDKGKSFSKPVELDFADAMSLGMRRGPRIAVSTNAICITAIGGKVGKGRDGDVLAVHSTDGGETWNGPVQVNDVVNSAREGLHAMAAGPNGELCCVWLDLRNKATELMASISADGGQTWSKNVVVYKSPDRSICECCHPSVTFDQRGQLYVQWRNSVGGNRDMYITTSADLGKTFAPAKKLGEGNWRLKACPMDGGAIAVVAGTVSSVWRREKTVFFTSSTAGHEQPLGTGEQPWIAATNAGPYVVWLSKRGESLHFLAPGKKSPETLSTRAGDPVIAASLHGTGPVVAAWESRDGNRHTIVCRVVAE